MKVFGDWELVSGRIVSVERSHRSIALTAPRGLIVTRFVVGRTVVEFCQPPSLFPRCIPLDVGDDVAVVGRRFDFLLIASFVGVPSERRLLSARKRSMWPVWALLWLIVSAGLMVASRSFLPGLVPLLIAASCIFGGLHWRDGRRMIVAAVGSNRVPRQY